MLKKIRKKLLSALLDKAEKQQPSIYDPLAEYQSIVLDAISIGRMGMSQKPDAEIQKAIQQFAVKYGLLGTKQI